MLAAVAAVLAVAGIWVQHPGPVLTPTQPWEQTNVQEPSVDYRNGLFRMWYTGADEGKCMIGYATSSDGLTWVKPLDHPVIGWGYGGVPMNACHSNVQYLAGRYYAWFSVDSKYYEAVENGNLYEATSTDGVTWTPLPKPAVRAKGWAHFLANSYVIRDHGHWLMFWEAFGNGLWQLSTATSTDLIHWKQSAASPLKGIGFGDTFGGPWIVKERVGWTMYFHAPSPDPTGPHMYSLIYQASSLNLKTWTSATDVLVQREQPDWQVDQIADPSVVTADGHRYMYFDGLDNSWPIRSSIGVAIS